MVSLCAFENRAEENVAFASSNFLQYSHKNIRKYQTVESKNNRLETAIYLSQLSENNVL